MLSVLSCGHVPPVETMNLTLEPIRAQHRIISCKAKHPCCFPLLGNGGCAHQALDQIRSATYTTGRFLGTSWKSTRALLMRITKPLIFARQIGYYLSLVRKAYNDNKYSQRG